MNSDPTPQDNHADREVLVFLPKVPCQGENVRAILTLSGYARFAAPHL